MGNQLIDLKLICDQLSPTLTKPNLTKSTTTINKYDNNTKYHPEKLLRNQKTKAKDQNEKKKTKLLVFFSLLCYNSLNWQHYDTDCLIFGQSLKYIKIREVT